MRKHKVEYGWICPRCGKVNAPFRFSCDCPADVKIRHDEATTTTNVKTSGYAQIKNMNEEEIDQNDLFY